VKHAKNAQKYEIICCDDDGGWQPRELPVQSNRKSAFQLPETTPIHREIARMGKLLRNCNEGAISIAG